MQNKENTDPLATWAVEAAHLLAAKHVLPRCECCGAFIPAYETPSAATGACSCIVYGHQNEGNRA
jgi:hypothetical protein